MPGGAPIGNQNAVKGKRFQKAIERVLARKYGDVDTGYEKIAEKYIEVAEAKEPSILRDLVDRSDGKPVQQIDAKVDGELTINLVRFTDAPVDADNQAP